MDESSETRQRKIIDLVAENGYLSVLELSSRLGVSAVTIRADLKILEEKGFVNRSRGGAQAPVHRSIIDRRRERVEEKTRIARAASALVENGDTIMIEAGTTTALIGKFLAGKQDVHIVTNSMLLFAYARSNPLIQITMTGGEFRRSTESLVGPMALRMIEALNVRLAFVGTDGFSMERGMTTHLVEGAEIVKAMVARAEVSVLVADSSKYGKAGFVNVLPLRAVSSIITDRGLDPRAVEELGSLPLKLSLV
jgi:DeoR family galactitol utilization operon repressor